MSNFLGPEKKGELAIEETGAAEFPVIDDQEDNQEEVSRQTRKEIIKEELRDAKCCRFCGLGSKFEGDLFCPPEFIPIFEKYNEAFDETLDLVINRYLPIKVVTSDPFYPRVICISCYDCLEKTIQFFDKICEGQKLLAKILNHCTPAPVTVVEKKEINTKSDLQFSKANPVINAPKRRGRPRKDPSKQPIAVSVTNDLSELPEIMETRAKRQSRPPVRYLDENIVVADYFKQEYLDGKDEVDCSTNYTQRSSGQGTSAMTMSIMGADFSNQDNLMDIEKLSVMMDGDEEIETSNGIVMDSSRLQAKTTKENSYNGDDIIPGGSLIIGEQFNPECSDGDETVKLSDLVGRRKKPVKRRKKYKKRVSDGSAKKIQCPQCPKSFNHPSSLVYHRLSAHDMTKKFVCEICNRGFTHKQLLTNHMSVHSSEKSFQCLTCPSKFKSRASLYTHNKSIHLTTGRDFVCSECGFQFNLKSSLTAHMRIHTKEKPYICEFCQKPFAQRSSLREHRRTHTGERPYVCSECKKSFTTASQLRSHKFSHSDLKSHLCNICGKGFSHAENFKYHMRRHTGEKPLKCPTCKKQFTEPWSLKKHFRLHSGEKPYKCDKCKKVFADPSNFAKHKKIHLANMFEGETAITEEDIEYETNIKEDNDTTLINKDIIDLQTQIGNSSSEGMVVSEDTSSIVQILNSDCLTYENMGNDGEHQVEQVIYVYSGDNPLFALSMSNSQQSSELRVGGESEVGEFQGIDSAGFTTVNPGEFESHYYSLETVDGTTVAVPITITPSNSLSDQLAIEGDEFKSNTDHL